jgi:hypothetical protein
MQPESASIIYRPDLAQLVQEYDVEKAAARFIARKAAPVFGVPNRAGQYPIMNRENFKKPASSRRAKDGAYNRITGKFGQGTYRCDENGLEYPIDDARREEYRNLINAEAAGSRILWYQLLLGLESRVAALYSGGGFTNHNVATAWSTKATALPLDDIETGIEVLEDKCGAGEGDISLIIPRADFREMLSTTQVVNKSQYTNPGVQPSMLREAQVAAMLGIKEVLRARSVYDSTEEGVAETNTQVWTAGVMYLAVLAGENDDLEVPSAARIIQWDEDAPELPVIESYRDDKVRSDIIRERMNTDEVLIGETDLFVYQLTNT